VITLYKKYEKQLEDLIEQNIASKSKIYVEVRKDDVYESKMRVTFGNKEIMDYILKNHKKELMEIFNKHKDKLIFATLKLKYNYVIISRDELPVVEVDVKVISDNRYRKSGKPEIKDIKDLKELRDYIGQQFDKAHQEAKKFELGSPISFHEYGKIHTLTNLYLIVDKMIEKEEER
jgi:hypothetical protein